MHILVASIKKKEKVYKIQLKCTYIIIKYLFCFVQLQYPTYKSQFSYKTDYGSKRLFM